MSPRRFGRRVLLTTPPTRRSRCPDGSSGWRPHVLLVEPKLPGLPVVIRFLTDAPYPPRPEGQPRLSREIAVVRKCEPAVDVPVVTDLAAFPVLEVTIGAD